MNKIKKALYNITRIYAKRYLTGNLGKVVEDNQKLTCYVKRSKFKKKDNDYTIGCFGIGDGCFGIREKQKKIADAYKLNKPICYVIDGIELKKYKVYIFGSDDCEVIIRNCNFESDLSIRINGKCILDNTSIKFFNDLYIGAVELMIKNFNSDQIEVISPRAYIRFGANDKINLINSNIGDKKKNIQVSFDATNELDIVNSSICGKEVECRSNKIDADNNSIITATNRVMLKTDSFDSINIDAPTIALNEEEFRNEKNSVVLKKVTDPLSIKRLELVNILKKVKAECETTNLQKTLFFQKGLNSQSVEKVLKK